MKWQDLKSVIVEATDRVIIAVEFRSGKKITIRNVPKALTLKPDFNTVVAKKAKTAEPNETFSGWVEVSTGQADAIDATAPKNNPGDTGASGGGFTPSSEEEIDMNNCLELAEHVRSRSKSITPFTFTDSSGDTDTIENPNETLNVDEAYNSTYNKFVELQENIIEILNAGKNIFYGQPPRPKREPGEPLAIGVGGDEFQYRNSVVLNSDDF